MILNLTDLSEEPLQSQIARQIRAMVLAGDLPAEESLPSIRAMAREQRISVITVQRAYGHLEREGFLKDFITKPRLSNCNAATRGNKAINKWKIRGRNNKNLGVLFV